jgi:uncharacterized protein (DUF1501 family)
VNDDGLEYEEIYALLSRPTWQDAGQVSRRRFLQGAIALGATAAVTSCVGGGGNDPSPVGSNDGILVVVLLGGGNDGLNTLAPVGDAAYRRLRPQLGLGSGALPIGEGLALHPSLRTMKARYDQGKVAIVRGVGQTNSDLSHFSSMANWMAGTGLPVRTTGWLGRWLDTQPDSEDGLRGVAIGRTVPLHMVGMKSQITALPPNGELFGADRSEPWNATVYDTISRFSSNSSGKPLTLGTWGEAVATAGWRAMARADEVTSLFQPELPDGDLVRQLTLAARLVNANVGVRVITTQLGSFDHHSGQAGTHAMLLAELDAGIDAFYRSLYPSFSKRVTLMTFSEFGRRPEQNASQGTDHGAASVMFLVGDHVRGGLHGTQPSLTDLDKRGDLKVNVDFRSVYQSVVSTWLNGDAKAVLNGAFPAIELFEQGPGDPLPPPGPWHPFASSKALVAQQYLDFMGRIGEQEGVDYWAGLLDRKVLSIKAVVLSFLGSAEFGEAVSPAARIGQACTGAPVSFSATVQWAALVRAKTPLIDIVRLAVALPAFNARYGALDNPGFVDKAHRDVLGRAPTVSWAGGWTAKLADGSATRADVMLDLSESPENQLRAKAPVDVNMTYVGMLRREPEAEGFRYWVEKVRGGVSVGELIKLFFMSDEYEKRFG